MHSDLSFQNPPALPHGVVAETLERAIGDRSHEPEAADALVGCALNDGDREFVEYWCVQVGRGLCPEARCLGWLACAWDMPLDGSDVSAMRLLRWRIP